MAEHIVCKRCGKCCYYIIPDKDGNLILKKCRHLRRNFKLRTTICRVYNQRKSLRFKGGMVIDSYIDKDGKKQSVWCVWRENQKFNYKGCPFNKKGNTSFEKHCEDNNVRFDEWKK